MVAESVAEELGEAAETKGITISIYNQIKNPVIEADLTMMMRVFMNLVGNAIQYGRENGYVKIYLEKEEETFQISVRDNGIGISKEDQEKIWDRFYRADQSRSQTEGFGLGLFMVKRIVENHGGVIVVESIPNEGSTFLIRLPEYRKSKSGENA